jgi:RND family efflux transporter MFP subunit
MNKPSSSGSSLVGKIIRFILPVLIFAGGVWLARTLIANPPKARRQPPQVQARLVEVKPVEFGPQRIVLRAMGEVRPARQVQIAAQVSGRVSEVSDSFEPGAFVKAGDLLLNIEDEDFQLALIQREAALELARRDLMLERGQGVVAAKEAEWSGIPPETEAGQLIRREPQIRAAEAAVESAEAALAQAKLNLERTEIRAPFDAVVLSKTADVGTYLNGAAVIAVLAGTDRAWIEAALPADVLGWLNIPKTEGESGSPVKVSIVGAGEREGRVLRRLSDIETQGRLARVLVEVLDPLARDGKADPLLWGAYATLELEGRPLENAAAIPRRYVHGINDVYVMDDNKRLALRKAEIVFRGRDHVYVAGGLEAGEKLITTDLPVAVEGMALRTAADVPAERKGP